jgi:hypothetical protein
MSFVTAIRDYVEVLNNLSTSFSGNIPIKDFLIETLIYFFKTCQYFFTWLFTFQWLRDFSLLPILIPQNMGSILKETFILENPKNVFFGFLEIPSLYQNLFLLGFFNSFFLALPFSVLHIIAIRRLFIKGIPSAVVTMLGYLTGQWVFIASVIFGLRFILVPWLTLEPLNYIIGFILIFRLVYTMTQENLREINTWYHPEYLNLFVVSLLLSWCEQTSIFQYLSNVTLSPTTSLMESFYSSNLSNNFLNHFLYIIGIIVGSLIFTFFWGWVLLQLKNIFIRYTPLFLSSFIQTINTGSFVLAIALSLSSIPFYGLDYLTTSPLGFVSQDRLFKNTIFDQYNIKDSVLGLGISSQFDSLDIDISPFDRGRYLIFPERTMPLDFEDVNYRGEAEWTTRYDKVSTMTDSRAGFLSLAKFFKKQKSEENLAVSRLQGDDQKTLPIKSKFNSDNNTQSNIALESKSSRFEDWYSNDSNQSTDDARPLESVFSELQDTSFPLDFLRTASIEPENLDLKLKQKYYSNPIYKNLLVADIDLFLNRQPSKFKLSAKDELDLYTKRRILSSYYDSLRDYAKLPYSADFESFFDGSKSFTNKTYNQQFKGTLRSLCRLFSLTTDSESLVNQNKTTEQYMSTVLKFDQPLYTFAKDKTASSSHEELNDFVSNNSSKLPFLQDQSSTPLYAGWDEKLRKFVITNKFLARDLAGYGMNIPLEVKNQYINFKNQTEIQKINFTLWPLKNQFFEQSSTEFEIPFTTLYIPQKDFEAPGDSRFDTLSTLPANWETRNRRSNIGLGKTYENIFDYLAPQRGGFIWPANSKSNLKIAS